MPLKRFQWHLDSAMGKGWIRRQMVGGGIFMTHSFLESSRPWHSCFKEKGCMATFVFMISGQTRILRGANGHWMEMNQGDGYAFVGEGDEIDRETPGNQQMEAVVVKINVRRLSRICSDLKLALPNDLVQHAMPLRRQGSMDMVATLEKIRYNNCDNGTDRLLAQAQAIDLVKTVFLQQKNDSHNREIKKIQELAVFITANINHEHRLTELAGRVAMNRTKLNQLFKVVHGCTVFDYIRREKLHKAEQFLRGGDMSITEIAHATGFCSSSHFCSFFQKKHGLTPKDFRLGCQGPKSV